MSALLLVADQQRDRDDLIDELLAHHELACELRARLDTTPRWRRRKRRRIDLLLREVCGVADRIRDALGARGREGMYELLERTSNREHGRTTR